MLEGLKEVKDSLEKRGNLGHLPDSHRLLILWKREPKLRR